MEYNIDAILDNLDIADYIDYLGIERKGKKVLCPAHDDTHFGSAQIWHKGIHCFVCGKFISANECTKIVCGVNGQEAFGIMADFAGGRSLYTVNNEEKIKEDKVRKIILTKDEMTLLGLATSKNYSDTMKETGVSLRDLPSLRQLATEDKEAYKYLIESKVKEKLEVANFYVSVFSNLEPTENVVLMKKAFLNTISQIKAIREKVQYI